MLIKKQPFKKNLLKTILVNAIVMEAIQENGKLKILKDQYAKHF